MFFESDRRVIQLIQTKNPTNLDAPEMTVDVLQFAALQANTLTIVQLKTQS